MSVITKQQLEDAQRDALDLGKVVNDPPGTVVTRNSTSHSTIAKLLADAAEALAVDGYTFFPNGHPAALDRIINLRLIGADENAGKFFYVKTFYYHDVGNRFAIEIFMADDQAGTGAALVARFTDGGTGYTNTGRKPVALTEVSGSGISGTAIVDFGNGSTPWGMYNQTSDTAGLPAGVILPTIDISDQIQVALDEANSVNRTVFVPSVGDDYLRSLILDMGIEGGIPDHLYGIGRLETMYFPTGNAGGPLWRIRLTVTDFTDPLNEYDVCQCFLQSTTTEPSTSDILEEWIFGRDDGTMRNAGPGIQCMMKIDWSKLVYDRTLTVYDSYEDCGLLPRVVYSNEDMDDYLVAPRPKRLILVGVGQEFENLTDAVASLHKYGLVENNQSTTLPWSNVCGYTHQVLIQIVDDWHHEDINELILPPYLTVRGKGMGNTVFYHESPDTTERLTEFRHSQCWEDCTVIQDGPAYVFHSDSFGDWSIGSPIDGMQYFRIRKVLRRVEMIANQPDGAIAWGWGAGHSGWEYVLFEDCVFRKPNLVNTAAIVGVHTVPGMVMPGTLHFRRCSTDSHHNTCIVLLSGFGQEQLNNLIVEGGNIRVAFAGSTFADSAADMPNRARQRVAWQASGDADLRISDTKMEVLKVAPGTVLGGSQEAIDALFGPNYDEKHGLGEMLIMEENSLRKLGARLGNRTSVNWTLSLNGGSPLTLNKNYTGMTEAAILADFDAAFGAGAITVANLANLIFPKNLPHRWIAPSADIARGRFVEYVGNKAQVTSGRPQGFTVFDMKNNVPDDICEARVFAAERIPELGTTDGEFGLVNGVATFGATPAVGRTFNGLATLY